MLQRAAARTERGRFLRWLRNVHGWLGLWGAGLGLLFGVSGILLNHRHVMKLPLAQLEEREMVLSVADHALTTPQALSTWLQARLGFQRTPFKIEVLPVKDVLWNGLTVQQPSLWKIDFHGPQYSVTTEYFVGNQFVSVKRQDANAFAFINRLHKGVGMSVAWVLLVDTLGGALIMLTITGVLLWTEMRRSRLLLAALTGGSGVLAFGFTLMSL